MRERGTRNVLAGLSGLMIAGAAISAAGPVVFVDATAAAGITFVHSHGGFGKKYLPETIGSGVVFFDMDADGWQDVLLVNARSLNPSATGAF